MHGLPPVVVKQSVTDPRELLPRDTNSEFSKLNLLEVVIYRMFIAGWYFQGITVGTSLRNANLQIEK